MSIRYWFPADEELNGAAGLAIADEDGGFIAGTMKCFAGLALAGVLAANALAAQLPYAEGYQVDERPAALLVDETEYVPTVRPAPLAYQLFDDDSDFAPPIAAIAMDPAGQWTVTVPRAGAIVRAVIDDDQYVGYLGTDEDGWLPPVPSSIARAITFRDDTEFVLPASIAIENYEWPVVQQLRAAPFIARTFTADAEFVPSTSALLDEQGYWPQPRSVPLAFRAAFADDGDFLVLVMAFDGRVSSAPLYDGSVGLAAQLDGAIAFGVLFDGRLTIYPA